MGKIESGFSSALLGKAASEASSKRHKLGRQDAALLKQVPLFAGLSGRDVRSLAGITERVHFGAGRTVVQNGSRGTAFYVILEGEAKVMAGYSGRARAHLGPGDFFGELALIDGRPRTASVIAETSLVTARIARAEFRKMLLRQPGVALKILEELSRRLRERSVNK